MKTSFAALVVPTLLFAAPASADPKPRAGAPSQESGWGAQPAEEEAATPHTTKATASIEIQTPPTDAEKAAATADKPSSTARKDPLHDATFLSGFRLGYSYISNSDRPIESLGGKSFQARTGTKSAHNFLIGYEVLVRMIGHSWLNVILLANGMIAGLEQSKILPSGNALIGFEFANSFQLGVGAHLAPLKGQEAHLAAAGGWTPRVGNFYIPVHAFFIPDVEGVHRTGVLTGVTW